MPWTNKRGPHKVDRDSWKNRPRTVSPEWMRGVKCFFICDEYNRANTCNRKEERTGSTGKLKSKQSPDLKQLIIYWQY